MLNIGTRRHTTDGYIRKVVSLRVLLIASSNSVKPKTIPATLLYGYMSLYSLYFQHR